MNRFGLVCLLFLLLSLSLNLYFLYIQYQSQIVVSVPDGDSLQLRDGRRIRLLGIDAPEKGRCGASEAYEALKTVTLYKHIQLQDSVTDDYGRQLANVYVGRQFVNERLVKDGLAKYTSVVSKESVRLREAADVAQKEQKGIYSPLCRSLTPPGECVIKGNLKNGTKIYHLPTCPNYSQTVIDLSYGDEWFCTEQEAQKAEFTKAQACP